MSLKHKKSSRCFYNKCEKFSANSMATEVAKAGASNVGQNIKITDDGLKKCSQCHLASYCNRDCQRKDWKYNHKDECFHIKKVTEDLEKLEANYGSQGILEPSWLMILNIIGAVAIFAPTRKSLNVPMNHIKNWFTKNSLMLSPCGIWLKNTIATCFTKSFSTTLQNWPVFPSREHVI